MNGMSNDAKISKTGKYVLSTQKLSLTLLLDTHSCQKGIHNLDGQMQNIALHLHCQSIWLHKLQLVITESLKKDHMKYIIQSKRMSLITLCRQWQSSRRIIPASVKFYTKHLYFVAYGAHYQYDVVKTETNTHARSAIPLNK